MVGVPGRSKACMTCRKRKIGCDQERPACQRCLRSGWKCEGYDEFPTFINRSMQEVENRQRLVTERQRQITGSTADAVSENPDSSSIAERQIVFPARLPMHISDTHTMDQKFMSIFFEKYVSGDANSKRTLWGNAWFAEAFQLADKGLALELSLRSVYLTRVGWLTSDESLVRRGQNVYGQALVELQKALNDENRMWSDGTLAAVAALQFYELYESTSASVDSWNNHVIGLAHLIQMRGPAKHSAPLAAAILENNRYNSMIQNVQFRRSTFWNTSCWRTLPWLSNPKDLIQKLNDCGFAIAGMVEQYNRLKDADETETSQILIDLLKRSSVIEHSFSDWFEEARSLWPSPMYWQRTGADAANENHGWGAQYPSFEFANPNIASTLVNYWALKVLLGAIASAIGGTLRAEAWSREQRSRDSAVGDEGPDTHAHGSWAFVPAPLLVANPWRFLSTPLLEQAEGMMKHHSIERSVEYANNIMRSLPYVTSEEHGIAGPQSCIFPIRVALFMYRGDPNRTQEIDLCHAWVAQLGKEKGLRYAAAMVDYRKSCFYDGLCIAGRGSWVLNR